MNKRITKLFFTLFVLFAFQIASSQTANLTSLNAGVTIPTGASISWHTGTPATTANEITTGNPLTDATAVPPGTYHMAFKGLAGTATCYTPTTSVVVLANACPTTTIDLTTVSTTEITNIVGTKTFHTGKPATATNAITATAAATATTGTTYYIADFDGTDYTIVTPVIAVTNPLPAAPTVVVASESCTAAASNTVTNYDATLTYVSTPTGLSVGATGVITGGTTGTSYTITGANAAGCDSPISASFTYDGDAQLAPTVAPTVDVVAESCTAAASNTVTNYDANLTYVSTPTGLSVGATGVITGGTTGTSYTITGANAAGCDSPISASFTYDGDAQLAPTVAPTVDVVAESCTAAASNTVTNYDANLTYVSTPTGLSVGATGVITGGTTGTSYTITGANAAGCDSPISASFTYDGDAQLAAPTVAPTVDVVAESCTAAASNTVTNYDANLTYVSTPTGLSVGATGVITGGTTGTSYTITGANAAGCDSPISASFTYDGDAQLAAPTVAPTVDVVAESCTAAASNTVTNYDANLTYVSTPTGLSVGAAGVITGGTTGTSYTITGANAAGCDSPISASFTYDGDAQLAAPTVAPTVDVVAESCTAAASNTVTNYDANLTYVSTPTGLSVGAAGVITGGTTGTSYTITGANAAGCDSPISASFTYDGDAQLAAPTVAPTVDVVAESCTAAASNTVTNYDATFTYVSTPTGLSVGAAGVITGGTTGTSYTITGANAAGCDSPISASFTYDGDAQLAAPTVAPTVDVVAESCTAAASNTVTNYDANLTYVSTPTGLSVGATGVITGGTTGTSYTITGANAAGCDSPISASFTYDGDAQLAAPTVAPTVDVVAESCTAAASNTVTNYDANLTYVSTPTGLSVGATGVITGGTTGTSYTITGANAAGCDSPISASFTYDGDAQLAAPTVAPTVDVVAESCTAAASNTVTNYDANLTYVSTPTGLSVGAAGVITGGTTGTSYTITGANAAGCDSPISSSFIYDGDAQLAAPTVAPTVDVVAESCTAAASNTVTNYDANLTYVSTPTGLSVGATGVITGGTTGTSYTITGANAAGCDSPISASFTYDGDAQLAAPTVAPTVVVASESCTAAASNTVTNYDPNFTYVSTPTGLSVGAAGVITGGTTGTSYTITGANAAGCDSPISVSFTYDGDAQLAAPTVAPTVDVVAESCTAAASNTVTNYDANLTYVSTPTGLSVGAAGVITGGTTGTSYTITGANAAGCDSPISVSFTYDGDAQLAAPTVAPTVDVVAESCTAAASNTVTNYDANLTYVSTPTGLSVGAAGVITGGTTGTSYTITGANAAGCDSPISASFTYDGDAQLAAPTVAPTVVVASESCTAAASNTVTNYDPNFTYVSTPTGLSVGAAGVITGGTTGTSYTITGANAAGCDSPISASFTYDGDAQLAVPAAPIVSAISAGCTAAASNTVTNYDATLTYVSSPTGLSVGVGGVITGGTNGTSYTITGTNTAGCDSTASASFTYSDDAKLTTPAAPLVSVVAESCTAAASNTVTNYDVSLTYASTPTGLIVGAGGVITGGTNGTSYTITGSSTGCGSNASASFTYDGDAQLAAPTAAPTVVVSSESCTAPASNIVTNYDATLTYVSTPTGLSVNLAGFITGGTTGTSYTITGANAAGCDSPISASFTYDGDAQLAAPTVAPTVDVVAESCTAPASNIVTNYDATLTYVSTPTGLSVDLAGFITGGTTGTAYTITGSNAAGCDSPISASFTYDGDAQLAAPTVAPTVVVASESCTAAASNTVTNYDPNFTYVSIPTGLSVGAAGVITGGTTGTSYTITGANAAGCDSPISASFTYDGDAQLAAPTVAPTVVVASESCTAAASNTVTNYDPNFTYVSTPTGLSVGAAGVITGGTTGTSYTITGANAAGCDSPISASFTYDGDAQLAVPAAPIVSAISAGCTAAASNTVTNYDATLTYVSSPTGLSVGVGGVITGGTNGTSYTITGTNTAGCDSTASASFTYSDDAQLTTPAAPSVSVVAESCTAAASNTVTNYDVSLTYASTPTGLIVGAGGVITGGTNGTSYTITGSSTGCGSNASASFTYDGDAQLAAPTAAPTVVVSSESCTAPASNIVTNYDATLTYVSTPTGLSVNLAGFITGGTTGTSYTITGTNAAGCDSPISASFTYDGDAQLAAPTAAPTVVVASESCTAPASNIVTNYDATLTYVSTPTGLSVDLAGFITGGTTGTSYTITGTDAAGCDSPISSSFIYDGDAQLAAPTVAPTVDVVAESCTAAASNTVTNYDANLTYVSTPTGLSVGATGVITGGTTGTSYTITGANAAGCDSPISASFTYDGDAQLAAPTVAPTVDVVAESCTAAASNTVTNYDATLTYVSTPTGLSVGATGVITGGTTGTSYTITGSNAAGCDSPISASFTYDGDAQLAAPTAAPTVVVSSESCTAAASNTVTNYDATLTYVSTPTGLSVGAAGVITGGTTGTAYTITGTDAAGCDSPTSASFTYDGDAQLAVPAAPIVSAISAGCTAAASNTVTNYDASFTYVSSPIGLSVGLGGVITGGTNATSYTITGTNAAGCDSTASASFTYSDDAKLTTPAAPLVSVVAESCTAAASNTVTNYDVSLTYVSTPTGLIVGVGGVITGGTNGASYTITGSSAGCGSNSSATFTYSDNAQLAVPTAPTGSVTVQPTCALLTGTIVFTPQTGVEYSIDGVNFQASETFVGVAVGVYTLTVRSTTNNICTTDAAAQVTVNAAPGAPTAPVGSVTTQPTCAVTTGTISFTPQTGVEYSIDGTNFQASEIFPGVAVGVYTLMVRSITDNTCTATATATTQVTAFNTSGFSTAATSTNETAVGGNDGTITATTTGGSGNYTYVWDQTLPTSQLGLYTAQSVSAVSPGSYTVTVTDTTTGCTTTDSTIVGTFDCSSAISFAVPVTTDINCFNAADGTSTIDVTAPNGPLTAELTLGTTVISTNNLATDTTDLSYTGLNVGSYTVTIKDASGCTGSLNFTINEPTQLDATASTTTNQTTVGGTEGEVTVTGSGGTIGTGYSYSWNSTPVQTTQTATGLLPGTYTVTITDANSCTTTAITTVQGLNCNLNLSASANAIPCNGGIATATAVATGGTGAISYAWTDDATSNTVNPVNDAAVDLPAGNYTIVATDTTGCSSTTSLTITEPAALSLAMDLSSVSCNGDSNGSIDLAVSGGTGNYNYAWTKDGIAIADVTQDLSGLTVGLYAVTVTDDNLCSAIFSGTITEPAAVGVTIASTVTTGCDNKAVITANMATGGIAGSGYDYVWTDSSNVVITDTDANPLTIDVTGLGNYTVTATDVNGCTATATTQVTAFNTSGFSTAATSTNETAVGGNDGTITATTTGGSGNYTYVWDKTSPPIQPGLYTAQSVNGVLPGSYTVTVTDTTTGCTTTDSTIIGAFDCSTAISFATPVTTDINCFSAADGTSTIDVTAPNGPLTAELTLGTTVISTNNLATDTTDLSYTGLDVGSYTVTIKDASGCTGSLNFTINEPTQLDATASTTTNQTTVGGTEGEVTVTASGGTIGTGYSYSWNSTPVQTTQTATGLLPGTYTVTITDANSCTTTAITTVQGLNCNLNLSASANAIPCNGGIATATAVATGGTGAISYAWTDDATSNTVNPVNDAAVDLPAGNYTIVATDTTGCSSTTSLTITEPAALSLAMDLSPVSCNGDSNGSIDLAVSGGTGNYNYAWTKDGIAIADVTQDLSGLTIGLYAVTVTDDNLCSATFSDTITQPAAVAPPTVGPQTFCSGVNPTGTNLLPVISSSTKWYSDSALTSAVTVSTTLATGNYYVTSTDIFGCESLATIVAITVTNVGSSCDDDDDGNPNITDPNPLTPTVADDVLTVIEGQNAVVDVLTNDDYLPGVNTTITDAGSGTAQGTVVFDTSTGEMTYTPSAGEGGTVTVDYTVCHTGVTPSVCETATVTITVQSDTDGDGIPDSVDVDDDNDGIPDSAEGTGDTDGDGIPDSLDLDSDNDGILDVDEGGNGALDTNNDGVIDANDTGFADTNNDGQADASVDAIEEPDTDGDGVPDYQDLDSDNDGINDATEDGNPDADGDGIVDNPTIDTDGDGIPDSVDADNAGFGEGAGGEPGNTDSDGDGIPDAQDLDSDDDGINDVVEGGNEASDLNGDGIVDGPDTDGDGIPDATDEDPTNFGDAGNTDVNDTDPTDPNSGGTGVVPDAGTDADGDGIADSVDADDSVFGEGVGNDTDGDGISDALDVDDDNDGIPDSAEGTGDTDGDGIPDSLDLDSDNDGILDVDEGGNGALDTNSDGVIDANDTGFADTNNDGQADASVDAIEEPDTDGDGIPDYQDLDSDNDGINDATEDGNPDADGDGIVDNPTTDTDGDGIPDSVDADNAGFGEGAGGEPGNTDSDGDGIPDAQDLDSDDDGINDVVEGGNEASDLNGDGIVDGPDTDGDGIPDATDEDPTNFGDAGNTDVNDTDPTDPNSGGTGVVPDAGTDADGDGIADSVDADDSVFGEGVGNDTDGDGISDALDVDDDNDGIPDSAEGTGDTDGDGIPDSLDLDSDNDGILDVDEGGNGALDTNSDGVIDANDTGFADTNNDGQADASVDAIEEPDTDGDGIPDYQDLDSDNDGINDATEDGNPDADGDGIVDNPTTDTDGDGIPDSVDADNAGFGEGAGGESGNTDSDGDGIPDAQDLDSDDDGINDVVEGGNEASDLNGDGIVDGPDTDGDGIPDATDEDPTNFGDAGNTDVNDTDPTDPNSGGTGVVPDAGTDADGDGIADSVDADDSVFGEGVGNDTDGDGISDALDVDDDNDGIPDSAEGTGDTDGDGIPDSLDLDSDNDGILDVDEGGNGALDTNSDGVIDANDTGFADTNNDGQADASVDAIEEPDTDGDGIPDYQDLDSDNDGINDATEDGNPDADGDGIVDNPTTDTDGDGIPDSVDADNAGFGEGAGGESGNTDSDGDGIPDAQDLDSDDDGINDVVEGGNEASDLNGDGIVDGPDTDGDGIPDATDEDPTNFGDAGNTDVNDTDPTDPNSGGTGVVPDAGTDADGDGIADSVDADDSVFGEGVGNDTDGDGISDALDVDDDNDGIPDSAEGTGDTDGDGIPDSLDLDSDNDGILDVDEGGNGALDTNSDGVIDANDTGFADTNNDGQADASVDAIEEPDTDGDGIPDYQDLDSDNDGINDATEDGNPDADGDGIVDNPTTDTDGDGIPDSVDADNAGFGEGAGGEPGNTDSDGDGIPDAQDLDSDDDGINDVVEGGNEASDLNGDGIVDGPDTDGDGIPDATDEDPTNFGDAGNTDVNDTDPTDPNSGGTGVVPDSGTDADGDGIADSVDGDDSVFGSIGTDTDGDGIPDGLDLDDDNDGIPDTLEQDGDPTRDTDGDGTPDHLDTDADGDGVKDVDESGCGALDADGDGMIDGALTGSGPNGLFDGVETSPESNVLNCPLRDTDGDGKKDFQDIDDDNDGILTTDEDINSDSLPINDDTDGDGTPNYLDIDDDGDGVLTKDEFMFDCDGDTIKDHLDLTDCTTIASAFTPNGDGVNDTFVVSSLSNYPNFKMEIHNRWGNIVYDYSNNGKVTPDWWDGYSTGRLTFNKSKPLPTGTYYYIINFNDGVKKSITGWVYLNR